MWKQKKLSCYRYFSFAPRHVTHQVAMPLQARHNCYVIMNNLYTWKAHSKIYWYNSETITLTVYLMEWNRVTQYHWYYCKEKILEKWRNMGENRKSCFYRYFSFAPRHVTHQVAMPLQARCNCNVIMNNLYTWKAHSKIYWYNSETITLTVYLMEWIRVTQYRWHYCKEKILEK